METRFSENARRILESRYLRKDASGKPAETPNDMLKRVARHVASADAAYGKADTILQTEKKFYRIMADRLFLPNSPTLMNSGRRIGQLAACFVLPVDDSMESIFDAVKHTAMIHKSGGGTGFSFSHIRPAKDMVSTTTGVSSGPLSFMRVFDAATEAVKQGGARRGANMGVLSIDHPDIEAFITAKTNPDVFTNFNLSVALTQDFLNALEKETDYPLVNPRNGETVKRVPARRMFNLISESAWKSGEPGILFIDRINADNPTPHLGRIDATNPCGEQPLLPYESCTLGSINLSRMVSDKGIMYACLKQTIRTAVHFLDNVIDVNQYPLPQIKSMSHATRKIGLGVMGFADMLIRLNIPYDSDDALNTADTIMTFIKEEACNASMELARRRGNFPAYDKSVFNTPETPCMRNATTTTIAPTGTISLIAGTSSGIEPLFAIAHVRRVMGNEHLAEFNPLFINIAKKEGFYSADLMTKIAEKGTLNTFSEVPPHIKRLFRTSHEISPQWHVKMQAAFQKHTDNAVSKTVNLPADATVDDVTRAFSLAAKACCKGLTIYRYGSRGRQVINLGHTQGEAILTSDADISFLSKDGACPECGSSGLVHQEGCLYCHLCGYSKCR